MRIPDDRDLDSVTPEDWRAASCVERAEFIQRWGRLGMVSFCCLVCGFPTARGMAGCDACQGRPLDAGVVDGRHLMNVEDAPRRS